MNMAEIVRLLENILEALDMIYHATIKEKEQKEEEQTDDKVC